MLHFSFGEFYHNLVQHLEARGRVVETGGSKAETTETVHLATTVERRRGIPFCGAQRQAF
jgi:hypothetical protein